MSNGYIEQRFRMGEFDGVCDTHLWAWTLWQALYTSINFYKLHNNLVDWELLVCPTKDTKLYKVLTKMMRGFGVNLRSWLDLKNKWLNARLEWLGGMENEYDGWEEHY